MQNNGAPTQNDARFRYRECLPLKLLPCRIFGDARESWPSLWTVSSHPPHPPYTHPAHGYKWCIRLVCVQVQGTLSSHPPPTPPTPCMGTSDPNEAKWSQFLVASDRELWSQVTACTVEVLLALSANVTFCGRKWPHFVVTSDPNPVFLFVVASDRILWSQVTAMPLPHTLYIFQYLCILWYCRHIETIVLHWGLCTIWVDRRKPPRNGSNLKISLLSTPWVAACGFLVAKSLVLVGRLCICKFVCIWICILWKNQSL